MTASDYRLNPKLKHMRCLRCAESLAIDDYFEGCPACLSEGFPVSVVPVYSDLPDFKSENTSSWLAYTSWPGLGEGNTPVVELERLANEIGVRKLSLKFEGANPTGSHKDRMSMLAVARAVDIGAPKVIAASSGNAGASLAAYAAVAGIECVIVTTPKISPNWRRAIEMHGAKLIATGTALERWKYTSEQVKTLGWYPVTNYLSPPTGSNPFGVDGYRTIAFELAMDPKCRLTNHVIVPTARADVLWGIAKGFCDLLQAGVIAKTPKVHAVEPFPRISVALASGNYRQSFGGSTKLASIAGGTTTYQALDALKLCGGSVVEASNSEALSDQRCLAQHGLYLENSSAACLTGLRKLFAKGVISPADGVTLVGTSHGYKEYEQIDTPINFA